jgi:hypothetical protein
VRDELAGRLLDRLMDWSPEEQATWMSDLLRLAEYKFDHYERFGPGKRFFESLARFLGQFDASDRRILLDFVRTKLVFVSREEMHHAIACAYIGYIKPRLICLAAAQINVEPHRVTTVVSSPQFHALRRKTLFLGLTDGARLDVFRRSNPELSHEQFSLNLEVGSETAARMMEKLNKACDQQALPGIKQFQNLVLIDDFYGSGTSLLEPDGNAWSGKLNRVSNALNVPKSTLRQLVTEDVSVSVLIYIASSKAEHYLRAQLESFHPDWNLDIVQVLPPDITVTDPAIIRLCHEFFDPALVDESKPTPVPLGYGDVALPVVLHHNTPNNSIGILWADTSDPPKGTRRHALFPRYERHHPDRP